MRMLRILAIILNAALLFITMIGIKALGVNVVWGNTLTVLWVSLSLAVPIVNVIALLLVPPLFQRYWFRTCLKGKTLEEQLELVEQARLNALKKDDSER